MSDQGKTKQQLITENETLRRRVAELEKADHDRQRLVSDLDLTFRLSPMLMCIAGLDGYLKRANPVYQETCGLTQEELLTHPFIESMHADDRPAFHARVDQLAKGVPVFNVETRMCRPDNTVRSILWTGIPMTEAGTVLCIGQDITATKEAEEALRDSDERFRSLFENSAVGTVITHDGVSLLHVNPAFCAFLGYSEDELRGKTIQSLSQPDDWEESSAAIRGTLEGGPRNQRFEKRYLHKTGRVLWGEVNFTLVCDAKGKPDYFITQVLDITERKRVEEALQQAHDELERHVEERTAELRSIYDGMPDGVLVADIETKQFVRCNLAMGRMLGFTEDELLARSVTDIHPANALPSVLETFHALVDGRQRIGQDIPMLCKDGSVFHADVTHNEITLNGRRCTVGFFRDITERKQAQEALRQSEERYELAARGAGVGILDWDIRTDKLYYSPRWKMLFGYGENEIGESIEDLAELLHPDEHDRVLKFHNDFPAGTSSTSSNEFRLRHKDGSYRWIVAHALAVRDEQGRACRLVGSHGDITDRKQAEEALVRERQSLWRMLQASDHERQIISYEIHDGLAQYLAAAGMQFQAHESLKERFPEDAKKAYETAVELVRQAHAESRRLINEVRPPVIDEIGLETAVSHLVHEHRKHGGPKIEYHCDVQFGKLLGAG